MAQFRLNKKRFKKRYLLGALPVIIVLVIFFFRSKGAGDELITLNQIEKENFEFSIFSNGTITSDQSVDLNPQSNGAVTQILVEEGDFVQKGQLLLSLDSSQEALDVNNAKLDLETAQIALEKLKDPVDESERKSAENALLQAKNDLEQRKITYDLDLKTKQRELTDLEEEVPEAEEDAFNTVAQVFVDLPTALADIETITDDYHYKSQDSDQKKRVIAAQEIAEQSYREALKLYEETSREDVESFPELTQATYDAVSDVSDLLKEMDILLAMLYRDNNPYEELDDQRTSVSENIAIINPHLSSMFNEVQTLEDLEEDIEEAKEGLDDLTTQFESDVSELELLIEEKELLIEEVTEEVDEKDIRTQEIEVEKRQNDLKAAEKAYQDRFISAPFSGTITQVNVDLGQSVSSSSSTFTLVSKEKLIEVDLNEIDVAQVEIGQAGEVRFDSFPKEVLSVQLAFISEVNVPDSPVVEYKAHFTLSEHNLALKEGMSAEVELILDRKENVLLIPRLALIEEEGKTYVEVVSMEEDLEENIFYKRADLTIKKVAVVTGLSNAGSIEIIEGLSEGDWVLIQSSKSLPQPVDPFAPPSNIEDEQE